MTNSHCIRRQIDQICNLFEDAWDAEHRPDIVEYLTRIDEEHRDELLVALLEVDIELRQRAGHAVSAEDYGAVSVAAVRFAEQLLHTPSIQAPKRSGTIEDETLQVSDRQIPVDNEQSEQQRIGPYELLSLIGEGGMGTVWKARQTEPVKRDVALKVIRADMGSKETIARFEAERQALALMDHPSIAKVLDAGTTSSGNPFFVMELVNGVPLNEYCDSKKLSIHKRLQLMVDICNAVQHAHQKGIIHRDLKPGNILITEADGKSIPKVIDFGLAKAMDYSNKLTDKTVATSLGQILGTLQYMSPEQAETNSFDIDTRTDVYALGVILYELLTGSTPLDQAALKKNALLHILELIRTKEPPRPSSRLSTTKVEATTQIGKLRKITPTKLQGILKGELDWVVMKALEIDRRRRYESADRFAQDIRRFLSDEPVEAKPPSRTYRLQKFVQKNRGLVTTAALIVGLLVAGISTSTWFAIKANREARRADESAKQEKTLRRISDQKTKEANSQRAIADKRADEVKRQNQTIRRANADFKLQLALARWAANRAAEAKVLLQQIPHEFRNTFEWNYFRRRFEGSDITFVGHTERVNCVCISPDGARIATGSDDKSIKIWNAVSGENTLTISGCNSDVENLCFSRDGKLLASYEYRRSVRIWDSSTGREVASDSTPDISVQRGSFAFSQDGKRLRSLIEHTTRTNANEYIFRTWDWESGEIQSTLLKSGRMKFVFSECGTKFATADNESVSIWDVSSVEQIGSLKGQKSRVNCISFSPDGKRLAAISGKSVTIWDVDTQSVVVDFNNENELRDVVFSPNGGRLFVSSFDGTTVEIWDLNPLRKVGTLRGHDDSINDLAMAPDGQVIYTCSEDNTTKAWNIDSLSNDPVLTQRTGWRCIAMSRDGSKVAAGNQDGTTAIWDLLTLRELRSYRPHETSVGHVSLSRDGGILATSDRSNVHIWNADTGAKITTLPNHSYVTSVALDPSGNIIATATSNSEVRIWDARDGKLIYDLVGHRESVEELIFSSDGTRLVSRGGPYDGLTFVWNVRNGERTALPGIYRVVTHNENDLVAVRSAEGDIRISDLSGETVYTSLKTKGNANSINAISVDGTFARAASSNTNNNLVVLWDCRNGTEIATLEGHSAHVENVLFHPKKNLIVTLGDDTSIRVWNGEANRNLR